TTRRYPNGRLRNRGRTGVEDLYLALADIFLLRYPALVASAHALPRQLAFAVVWIPCGHLKSAADDLLLPDRAVSVSDSLSVRSGAWRYPGLLRSLLLFC